MLFASLSFAICFSALYFSISTFYPPTLMRGGALFEPATGQKGDTSNNPDVSGEALEAAP
jgi:hypothetical protein